MLNKDNESMLAEIPGNLALGNGSHSPAIRITTLDESVRTSDGITSVANRYNTRISVDYLKGTITFAFFSLTNTAARFHVKDLLWII
jgi:hypothetical protein